MKQFPSCSLIISTYNAPDRLQRCLQSVFRQTVKPAEIIIADDGSGEATKHVIGQMKAATSIPIVHVWQPDDGFQLARIRNKAFLKASGDYIINIDGDILLHKNFVHDHLYFARPGQFIAGDRALLTPASTAKYMNEHNGFPSFYSRSLNRRVHAFRSLLAAKSYRLIRRAARPYLYVIGCNMSFWRNDLLAINGYNEAFQGWGKEDNDIALRLINSGVKQCFMQFYAIVFHLYHPENDRSKVADNMALLQESERNKITRIEQGIDKHTNN